MAMFGLKVIDRFVWRDVAVINVMESLLMRRADSEIQIKKMIYRYISSYLFDSKIT